MIKAKDICKIRNLTKEQLEDIEGQLFNIEMLIDGRRAGELHREVFIDRYINNISVERLVDKYNISRTNLYRIFERAVQAFEYNGVYEFLKRYGYSDEKIDKILHKSRVTII